MIHKDVGVKLLRWLGIDPSLVNGFTLHCRVGEAVTVELERFVESPAGDLELLEGKYVVLPAADVPKCREVTHLGSEACEFARIGTKP